MILIVFVFAVKQCDVTNVEPNMRNLINDHQDAQTIPTGSLSEVSHRKKRQVLKDKVGLNTTWRGGVFYTFKTQAHDKVVEVKRNGCSSNVGPLDGDQVLCLDDTVNLGTAMHEIGHVLGFFHTQQRYDRDDFVKIAKKILFQIMSRNSI
ncbi:Astacin (Peptidase M12A) [Parelaphostrongylus tenuis]|uniref:Metalloendopeptidase n=1 Tax=Parelaphostrongylus tenuis TaxID=148309 RepID=A0AAD5QN49_PARTN|nr:Astacin (Peptidase M12A) [Parelaphostrongylus tenuis]